MKAPISWLKDYVDIDCSVEVLVEKLFSSGFEVEDIIYVGKNIDKIVTCKVLTISQHPNADKLSVVLVDAGKYGKLQIVTSAKNIYEGAVVPVALDNSTLNNGEKIKTGELRGVTSYGMFCSGEELGINDDWYPGASVNGILILDESFPLGEEVKTLLEIDDVILDINVTANRPDCHSILGLAREVSAVLKKPLKMPELSYSVCEKIRTTEQITVENNAFDLCPRYIAHLVKDIKISDSPLWLKRRLSLMGIRSISNIVDITNYVLLEIGQPMHAFDLNNINDNKIVIRRANNSEKIITLDEKEFTLNSDNLVICDAYKPVALAGIMGGLNSEIKQTTTDVVFESATFKRDNIRKTSRSLGQRSDSSSRFEKGVDLYSVDVGIKRALHLIDKLGCGTIACDNYDLYEGKLEQKVIQTKISKINEVLGIEVSESEIVDILKRLTFNVSVDGDNISVTVPLYRDDMEDYPDIAEEVIRQYGYDNINSTLLKTSKITNGGLTESQRKMASFKDLLVGLGFNEIITYSFVPEKDFNNYLLDDSSVIKILNPISEDLAVMRQSLIPSMVRTVGYNLNRKNYDGRLFEVAKIYSTSELPLKNLPKETNMLVFSLFGDNEDFFTTKGIIESILSNFCCGQNVKYEISSKKFMHPTRSAEIFVENVNVGLFGQLSPEIMEKLDIDKPVYIAEINYDLLETLFNDKIIFKPISKFPTIERDLAILVDDNVRYQDIYDTMKNSAGSLLSSISLFDVYKGEHIPAGKKSMAFNLVFSSIERTLSVEEIDELVKNILKTLKDNLQAELR